MPKIWKRTVMTTLGVTLSAAALWFFLRKVQGHWEEVGQAFGRASYAYLIPSVGFIALMYGLRVLRWRVFLDHVRRVRYYDIAAATCIGFMSSCVLPLRAGEVIRPYVLHKKSGLRFGHAAGTAMGLERVFDLIGACFLLALTLLLLPIGKFSGPPAQWLSAIPGKGAFFAGIALAAMSALVVVAFLPGLTVRFARFFLKALPHSWALALEGFISSAVESLAFLKRPGRVATALLLSLALWFCYPLSTWAVARGFGLEIPFAGILLAQVMVTVAVALPQAPGFIGMYQAAAMTALQLYGVAQADAAAFAIMMWAVNVFPITLVGLGLLWYEGLSLRGLRLKAEDAEGAEHQG